MLRSSSFLALISGILPLSTGCSTIGEDEIEPGIAGRLTARPEETSLERASGWHEWRGFGKDGVVAGITLPEELPAQPWPELWREPVGQGLSGVVAVEGKVFCHARLGDEEIVTCRDAATGRLVWSYAYEIGHWGQPFAAFGIDDGPLATPTYARGRLYTVGIHGLVLCLDTEDGGLIFSVRPHAFDGNPSKYRYGHASSPLVREGSLYVSFSTGQAGQVVALDGDTGRLRWRAIEENVTYTSPVYARIHGMEQIVVRTWQRLIGLEPATGRILWEHAAKASGTRRDCATPLVVGDTIFVTNNVHGTIALRVLRRDDGTWTAERLYRTGALAAFMASLVYHEGHAYGLHKRGRFVCMEAATEKRRWGARDFGSYLSMISFGSRVLALDERGKLAVLSLSPEEYRVEATWKVGDYTWGHIGVDERHLFFRDGEDLVCLAFK